MAGHMSSIASLDLAGEASSRSSGKKDGKKKKTRQWSEENMKRAFELVKFHGYSKKKAADECGVPRTTLRARLAPGGVPLGCKQGAKPILSDEAENLLANEIRKRADAGVVINRERIKEMATSLDSTGKLQCSNGWFQTFFQRHPDLQGRIQEDIASRKPRSIRGRSTSGPGYLGSYDVGARTKSPVKTSPAIHTSAPLHASAPMIPRYDAPPALPRSHPVVRSPLSPTPVPMATMSAVSGPGRMREKGVWFADDIMTSYDDSLVFPGPDGAVRRRERGDTEPSLMEGLHLDLPPGFHHDPDGFLPPWVPPTQGPHKGAPSSKRPHPGYYTDPAVTAILGRPRQRNPNEVSSWAVDDIMTSYNDTIMTTYQDAIKRQKAASTPSFFVEGLDIDMTNYSRPPPAAPVRYYSVPPEVTQVAVSEHRLSVGSMPEYLSAAPRRRKVGAKSSLEDVRGDWCPEDSRARSYSLPAGVDPFDPLSPEVPSMSPSSAFHHLTLEDFDSEPPRKRSRRRSIDEMARWSEGHARTRRTSIEESTRWSEGHARTRRTSIEESTRWSEGGVGAHAHPRREGAGSLLVQGLDLDMKGRRPGVPGFDTDDNGRRRKSLNPGSPTHFQPWDPGENVHEQRCPARGGAGPAAVEQQQPPAFWGFHPPPPPVMARIAPVFRDDTDCPPRAQGPPSPTFPFQDDFMCPPPSVFSLRLPSPGGGGGPHVQAPALFSPVANPTPLDVRLDVRLGEVFFPFSPTELGAMAFRDDSVRAAPAGGYPQRRASLPLGDAPAAEGVWTLPATEGASSRSWVDSLAGPPSP